MILLPSEIQQNPVFKYCRAEKADLFFASALSDGILKFEFKNESGSHACYTVQMIHEDESALWLSVKELLTQSVKMAEASLFGRFDLQLLLTGDLNSARTMNIQNLSQFLINHARKLQVSGTCVFSYSGAWFYLKYLMPLDWGKITFKTHLNVFRHEREKLDAVVKKLLKYGVADPSDCSGVMQDFSQEPLFRFGEDAQTARLSKLLAKQKNGQDSLRGLYYLNQKRGDSDLLEQFAGVED